MTPFFLKPFKNLSTGLYRLFIISWIIIPSIFTAIFTFLDNSGSQEETFITSVLLCFPLYYILSLMFVWVYLGFKK